MVTPAATKQVRTGLHAPSQDNEGPSFCFELALMTPLTTTGQSGAPGRVVCSCIPGSDQGQLRQKAAAEEVRIGLRARSPDDQGPGMRNVT